MGWIGIVVKENNFAEYCSVDSGRIVMNLAKLLTVYKV